MRSEGNLGSFLKEKNALINYIYDPYDNSRIGIVIGVRGESRDNPRIGFAFFGEFSDRIRCKGTRFTTLRSNDNYLKEVHLLDSIPMNDQQKKAWDTIKRASMIHSYENPSKDLVYEAVELAFLRANTNRDKFFVCNNPKYYQNKSVLIPKDSCKQIIYGKNPGNHYYEAVATILADRPRIATTRQAVRAMEYRCWRYFKDSHVKDMNNVEIN